MRKLGFETRIPVVQAPMAGGNITTPELVAAVSNSGGLGSLAGGYASAREIEQAIRKTRALTDRPFAVNLFAPGAHQPLSGDVGTQLRLLAPIHERLGLDPPAMPDRVAAYFTEQMEAVLAAKISIVSFTFGLLPPDAMNRLHGQGAFVMGTATTVAEAKMLEAAGVDAVVAQGGEAGAHRGTFDVPAEPPLVGTMALVPQIADAIKLPVIASGGIMDGRGIVAAIVLGASAAQMGTAFLTCDECGAPPAYKRAVLDAPDDSTSLTRAFSGRWARAIRNRFMEASRRSGAEPLSYPWQNSLTVPMRAAAGKKGDSEYLSLWAGQGTRMARPLPAADLMRVLEHEIQEAIKGVSSLGGSPTGRTAPA
jgi:nitronate monooxygenase